MSLIEQKMHQVYKIPLYRESDLNRLRWLGGLTIILGTILRSSRFAPEYDFATVSWGSVRIAFKCCSPNTVSVRSGYGIRVMRMQVLVGETGSSPVTPANFPPSFLRFLENVAQNGAQKVASTSC